MKKTDVIEQEKPTKAKSTETKEKFTTKKPFKKRFWVEVKIFDQGEDKDILMPEYKTIGSCGCDLKLADETVTIEPGFRYCVGTGIGIKMTRGYVGFVTPRSGLAYEHGLSIVNSPGEIDNDYRGEIKVTLINLGDKPIQLKRGDRIAQLTFVECKYGNHFLRKVDEFSPEKVNERGNKGFGSTGIESEIVSEDKEESSENNEN